MSRPCPIYGKAIYLDCLECEEKYCKREKKCKTCIHSLLICNNHRCEYTGNKVDNERCMRYECSKYERITNG